LREAVMKNILRIIGSIITALLPVFRKEKIVEDSVIVVLELIIAILILVGNKL
jgi:hypothetical protein